MNLRKMMDDGTSMKTYVMDVRLVLRTDQTPSVFELRFGGVLTSAFFPVVVLFKFLGRRKEEWNN
jgi:hypothetical protein